MIDPIGLTGTIITILNVADTVIAYIKDAKGTSEDKKKLRNEVRDVKNILEKLQDQADDVEQEGNSEWATTLKIINDDDGPLQQIKEILKGLKLKLQPGQGLKWVGKTLYWHFEKKEVDKILLAIERQKSLLTLALQNNHM